MFKRVVIATVLGLSMFVPAASAQSPDAAQGAKPGPRVAGPAVRKPVRRPARLARIPPAERAQLRAKRQDLRARVQALRQSGQRPTLEERRELRTQRMQLRRDVLAARRGR
jgi:TolA-binding protein